jgi:hypothetical protein
MLKPLPTGRQANVKSISNDQMPKKYFWSFGFWISFEL